MIMIDIEMPQCCADCFALDESGDYPHCRISHEQRGYTFDVTQKRMPSCPMKDNEPRVMTLEDIETVGDSEPVYIETKISEKVNPAIFQPECSDGEYACVISSWSKSGFYSFESYYQDWRCWTSRPTDKQREATPWTE